MNRTVIVQQYDGASSDIAENDQEHNLHASKQGMWNICFLETQPAKSPETNVLDLSFFQALQAKQWSLGSETTIDELVAQVLQAFRDFEPRKIDCGFLILQGCLNDMLEVNGRNNNYKIWRMGKQVLFRQFGYLPRTFAADATLQVVQMFSGDDGGKISNIEDNDLNAGAGDGTIDQMIMPILTV